MDLTNPFQVIAEGTLMYFGNPVLAFAGIIFFIAILLLSVRVPKSIVVIVLLPLITSVSSYGISTFIGISGAFLWVSIIIWAILGIIMSAIFYKIMG